jgi:hypothetical protein
MIWGAGGPAALMRLLSPRAAAAPQAPAGIDAGFAALLDKARDGQIHSGRDVTIAHNAGIELSHDQLQRLAAAADQAEAHGATRALVLIDGLALRIDVTMREVTGAVDLDTAGVFTDIDAVVRAPGTGTDKADIEVPSPGTGQVLPNASLLKALSGKEEER